MTGDAAAGVSTRLLGDGHAIPLLGLGVWQTRTARVRERGPLGARAGLPARRHRAGVRQRGERRAALRESGVARDEVFVTTKFHPRQRDPAAAIEESLARLGLDYVDLYIVHWPQGGPTWAWPGMERHASAATRARSASPTSASASCGSSLAEASVPPVVNQVQFSPYAYRRALLDECDANGIVLEAYSPLGTGRHLSSDTVARIAESLGRTPAQVLLRWCIERTFP